MIAPDMATMLCFVVHRRDDPGRRCCRRMLSKGVDASFNCITVDSDTSTSRHAAALRDRPGASTRRSPARRPAACCAISRRALDEVLLDLAHAGGARRRGGAEVRRDRRDRRRQRADRRSRIALAIANSPLVKTAIAGEDANWGRIVMAVGKAGEPADRDRLSIALRRHLDGARRRRGARLRRGAGGRAHEGPRGRRSRVDLGLGRGTATVWTCDLTHGYIEINGSYRS